MRQIEADGKRYEFVGSEVIDSWAIKLTGTLIEIVPGNITRVLATGEATDNEGKTVTTVKTRTALKDTDYIESVTWVGDTSKGAMMITLFNALNTSGATLTINEKGEGTLPFISIHAPLAGCDPVDNRSAAQIIEDLRKKLGGE